MALPFNGHYVDDNGRTREVGFGQYDNKVVTEPTPIIELNATYPLSLLRDVDITSGTGAVTQGGAEFRIRHQASGDFARLSSADRGRYLPGTAAEASIGVRTEAFDGSDDDLTDYWGYYDFEVSGGSDTETINEGAMFGQDKTGNFVVLYKGGEELLEKTYQSDWNINTVPWFDPKIGYQYKILYNFYGYGLWVWAIIRSVNGAEHQQVIPVHSFKAENETSLNNTNLQISAHTTSTNSSQDHSIYVGGRQYAINGKYLPETRETSVTVQGVTATTSSYDYLCAIRRKAGRREVSLEPMPWAAITTENIDVRVLVGGTLTGASWTDPDAKSGDETAIEVDTSATSYDDTGAVGINSGFAAGGQGAQKGAVANQADLPTTIPDEEIIVFLAKSINGTSATVDFKARMLEIW